MGKGYNNYMCKKPFHPGSKANIKRAWMAEQKTENEKKKQDELKVQYEKEQDLYNNRALISSESKDKLELNFMYEAPPGAKRERQKEDDEPEYKFEWQRKYNAPREDYAKGNEDIKDQPFGIPVRNVRCIKCHKWGHINTDKECPLYNQASTSSMPTTSMDPMELMRQMKEDGYGLKENVLGHQLNPAAANQQFIPSDESDPEMDFLKSLSSAEKRKLLKKLKKLSKKQAKSSHCKKKKSKKNKKSKSKDSSSSDSEEGVKAKMSKSSSSSDSESSNEKNSKKKSKRKKSKHSDSLPSKNCKSPPKDSKKLSSDFKETTKLKEGKSNHKKNSDYNLPTEVTRQQALSGKKYDKCERDSTISDSTCQKIRDAEVEGPLPPKKHEVSPRKSKTDNERKSDYSLDSSEDERHKISSQASNSKKTKHESDSITSSKKRKHETHESGDSCDEFKNGEKCKHPDGFSHLCPQALIEENYLQSKTEYKGDVHDRFRHLNREKRSPSVKQKYNK